MRSRLVAIVSWCAATALAVALVTGGVRTIRSAARRDTVVDVQAISVSGRTIAASGASATPPTTAPPAVIPTTTTAPQSAGPRDPGPGSTTPPATSAVAPPTTAAEGPTPAGGPPQSGPSPVSPSTTAVAAPVVRTIDSRGGSVTVRADASSLVIVAATPNPGYTSKIDQRGATAIRVEFENGDRRSRIDAWWAGGVQSEVRED